MVKFDEKTSRLVGTKNNLLNSNTSLLNLSRNTPRLTSSLSLSASASSTNNRSALYSSLPLVHSSSLSAEHLSVKNCFLTSVSTEKRSLHTNQHSVPSSLATSKRRLSSEVNVAIEKKHKQAQDVDTSMMVVSPVGIEMGEEMPQYHLKKMVFDEPERVCFTALTDDPDFQRKQLKLKQQAMKVSFLTTVSASLVNKPKLLNIDDETRKSLIFQGKDISRFDPEFILKVALYTRQELNIRSVANFLLSYSAYEHNCRPYLKKYFKNCVRLPSDWIEISMMYQTFPDREQNPGSLPAILRKVMKEKFVDFDEYQLAKYNKSPPKKKSKEEPKDEPKLLSDDLEIEKIIPEDEMEEDLSKRAFTLKRLIRLLHIHEPVVAVMSLLGKRYPTDAEEFRRSRLPGMWEEDSAGKRMKLPVPETWETQLSLRGNKKEVWEQLIDDSKLPYMAMLRNLRNLILADISANHHSKVLTAVAKEKAVIKSRQFPLSFYSAYKAIVDLENEIENAQNSSSCMVSYDRDSKKAKIVWVKKKKHSWKIKKQNKLLERAGNLSSDIFEKYKSALEKAMEISVRNNLNPIPGRTLVISDALSCKLDSKCKDDKLYMGNLLLSMMCLFACEECELQVVRQNTSWMNVPLGGGTLLENVLFLANSLKEYASESESFNKYYAEWFRCQLDRYLCLSEVREKWLNNIVFLANGNAFYKTKGPSILKSFLQKYRAFVNPRLLFVCVDVSGSKSHAEEIMTPLDVYLSGCSDQLLRFMSECGSGAQLSYVENIDKKYNLKQLPRPLLKDTTSGSESSVIPPYVLSFPEWKTVRVFISSTFKDMHGERDLLVRYVFPELRARARSFQLNVHEIDLRWGITESEAINQGSLELCLTEVSRCQLFVGILGERYGWIPLMDQIPNDKSFDWVREYPHRASLTELEIHSAALSDPQSAVNKAFFFFRNPTFEKDIPSEWRDDFVCENSICHEKMEALKTRIKKSGLEVFDSYPCEWGKVIGGCPYVSGLDEFGQKVLDNLWNAICCLYSPQEEEQDRNMDIKTDYELHLAKAFRHKELLGRKQAVSDCLHNISDGILLITGKTGCGKTAFLGHLFNHLPVENTFIYFVGLSSNEENLSDIATLLIQQICQQFSVQCLLPSNKVNLMSNTLWEVLREAVNSSPRGYITLLIDGIEKLKEVGGTSLDWLPCSIPPGIRLVLTATADSQSYRSILSRCQQDTSGHIVILEPLPMDVRKEFVANSLEPYRKTLSTDPFNNQMLLLVAKRDAGFPAYLQLACEELKAFGIFEELTQKIRNLPPTFPRLLQEIVVQMEVAYGKSFLEAALILLSISCDGLKEHELGKIMNVYLALPSLDQSLNEMLKAFYCTENLILPMKMALFFRSFRSFLCPNSSLRCDGKIVLNDPTIQMIVNQKLIGQREKISKFHKLLAAYFISICYKSNGTSGEEWISSSPHVYRAIPYHLLSANCLNDLASLFCSLKFLSAICSVGVAGIILADIYSIHDAPYRPKIPTSADLLTAKQQDDAVRKVFEDYVDFLSRNLEILTRFPFSVYQQAVNEPLTSSLEREISKLTKLIHCFELLTKNSMPSSCFLKSINFSQEILCVSCSSDGKLLALGVQDALVYTLNPDTGKLMHTFIGHSQAISSLCFVGINKLCSGSYDGTLSLWDVVKGIRIATLVGHRKRVSSCCSDTSGNTIVSVSWDTTLRVWSARDGREITCISKNKSPLMSVAFHPSKQLVVTGGWDKTLKLWDLEKMNRKAIFRGHSTSVQSVAFSPSGLHFASGDLGGKICVWSTISGAVLSHISGHQLAVSSLRFISSGNAIVSSSHDGVLKVWGNHWQTSVHSLPFPQQATVVHFVSLHHLAVGSAQGLVVLYDIENGTELWRDSSQSDQITCLAKYDDKSESNKPNIMIGTESGILRTSVCNKLLVNTSSTITAAVSKNNVVIAGNVIGQIIILNSSSPDDMSCWNCVEGHQGKVTALCFASSGIIISAGTDKCIKIWKLEDWCVVLDEVISNGHSDWITTLAFSDGLLATGSQDSSIKLWNLDSRVTEFETTLDSPVAFVAIEGHYVFGGGSNGSICMWSKNGKIVSHQLAPDETIKYPIGFVFQIRNENDEKKDKIYSAYLAVVENHGEVVVRKPFSYSQMASLEGHYGPVTCCASQNSEKIVSSSVDGLLRFWSVELIPREIKSLQKCHREPVLCVGVSMNGKSAFSTDGTGGIFLWTLQHGKLVYETLLKVISEEYSVSAAVFVNPEGQVLVCAQHCGGQKPTLFRYNVKIHTETKQCLLNTSLKLPAEVTTIHWSHCHDMLLIAMKNGNVFLTDSKLTKPAVNVDVGSNWCFAARMPSRLSIKVAVNRTIKEFKLPNSTWPSIISSQPDSTYKVTTNKSTLVSVLELDNDMVYTGGTDGILNVKTESDQHLIRAHSDCIVGICFWEKYMFTGSKDGTVKAWLKSGLQQVGLFTFTAPVTCLTLVDSEVRKSKGRNILVGTFTGEIHLLSWWTD